MQNVSNAFKIAALQQAREVRAKATLTLEDQTVFHLTAADFVSGSLSMTQQIMTKSFEVGTAYASEGTLSLLNHSGDWDDVSLEGALFQPYSGLVLDDDSVEYVLLGSFIVDEVVRAGTIVSLKGSDRLVLLDRPLTDVSLGGLVTAQEVLEAICTRCLIPIKAGFDDTGLDVPFTENLAELSGLTCRSIVAQIALLVGAVVRMTRTGELDFVRVAGASAPHVLPYGSRMSFEQKGDPSTLTGLIYGGGADPILFGADTGDVLVVSELTVLAAAVRESALAALWGLLDGYTLTGYTANYWGNPAIDAGDVIKHELKDDKEATGILMRHTFRHGGASTLESFTVAKTDKKYQAANSRRWVSMLEGLREQTDERLTRYEQAAAHMSDMLGLMMGVYPSQEEMEDGSIIYYWHNNPTREESDIIWMFNGLALAVSNDGGQTWTGQTSDGTVIANIVHTLTLTASMILVDDNVTVQASLYGLNADIAALDDRIQQDINQVQSLINAIDFKNYMSSVDRQAMLRAAHDIAMQRDRLLSMMADVDPDIEDYEGRHEQTGQTASDLVQAQTALTTAANDAIQWLETTAATDEEDFDTIDFDEWDTKATVFDDAVKQCYLFLDGQTQYRWNYIRGDRISLGSRIGEYEKRVDITSDAIKFFRQGEDPGGTPYPQLAIGTVGWDSSNLYEVGFFMGQAIPTAYIGNDKLYTDNAEIGNILELPSHTITCTGGTMIFRPRG